MPRDVIAVDSATKDYLQQKGFAPIGYKDYKWIFHKTDTLTNILNDFDEKGGRDNNG